MNTVYLAKELDYDHDATLGVYSTFDDAENAIHSYYADLVRENKTNEYFTYCVAEVPFNKTPTFHSVNYDRKFTEIKVK